MAFVRPISRLLPWSAALIAAVAAVLVYFAVMWLVPSRASADEAEPMYNPNQVAEINLTLPQEKIEKLEENPDEYQTEGTFELKMGGLTVPPSPLGVEIKLKGHTSFRTLNRKAAFKLKFKKTKRFLGLRKMTLNNMVQDPSMVHETLAYEMFRTFGLPAERTGYAVVHLNGKDYGVYLNLETLDDEATATRMFGPENTQHLYEADDPGVDVRPGQASTFEIQEGDETNISDLEKLIEVVNAKGGDWSDGMATVADLGEMVQMWSVERYVGNWDGYAGQSNGDITPNNYYLHSTPTGIFAMLPWGTDQTWSAEPTLNRRLTFGEPAGGRMFNYCYEDASCKAQYIKDLEWIYLGAPGMNLDAHAVALSQMLAPYQAEEEPARREFTAAQIAAGVAETRQFIADRQRELAEYLWPKPPTPALPRHAWIGKTRVHGAVVFTHLHAFAPGRAVQRVKARGGGRQLKGCTGEKMAKQAGKLTVSCRLAGRARALLKKTGRLRLQVRVGFVANPGGSPPVTRNLTDRLQGKPHRHGRP